jgi:phosphoserine phosphatase
MSPVLSLIVDPARPRLNDDLAGRAIAALAAAGVAALRPDWLAPGIACDIALPATDAKAARTAAAAALADEPVDVNVVPSEGRRKALLVADMDATMVAGETLDEMAALAGVADRVVPITERAMRGEIGFREAVIARIALLAGRPADIIDGVLANLAYTPGGGTLVATMRRHGALCALVSGGFDAFTAPVAAALGFDRHAGNRLLVEDGRLTGQAAEPILGRDAKRDLLCALAAERGIDPSQAIAVGDGANDIPMIESAGLGVAFRAKPAARAAADAAIDHGDLTALLYLQGYRISEFHPVGDRPSAGGRKPMARASSSEASPDRGRSTGTAAGSVLRS